MEQVEEVTSVEPGLPGEAPYSHDPSDGQNELVPGVVAVVDQHLVGVGDLASCHFLEPVPLLAH
jgi:hypothetical protein